MAEWVKHNNEDLRRILFHNRVVLKKFQFFTKLTCHQLMVLSVGIRVKPNSSFCISIFLFRRKYNDETIETD